MSDFIHLVEHTIQDRRLFRPRQKLLVAVSGGLDSTVLLHGLHRLAKKYHWKLVVAHFNHQLRGRSSDADERFVRQTAERLRIPFVAGRGDVKSFARKHNLSVEMAARHLRHDFLARTARTRQAATVALGHHAGDQVELFFLRLLRGAGVEGLAGMKWASPSPANAKVTLTRPLLGCSRNALEQFAREENIRFREDKTNTTLDFLRNRVRHELLPLLVRNYQPALVRTTLRLMELLEAESGFVGQSAQAWLDKRKPAFDQLPVAIQRRSVQLQLFRLGLKADFDSVEHLRLRPRVPLTLSPKLIVKRDSAGTVQAQNEATPQFAGTRLELGLKPRRETVRFGGLKFGWYLRLRNLRALAAPGGRPSPTTGCESFDADKVGATIALRHWLPGDRFHPIGMPASVKLQDLFSNQKIPRARRHELVVATAEDGELFWVQGLRISERFKLDKSTTRVLNWHWQAS